MKNKITLFLFLLLSSISICNGQSSPNYISGINQFISWIGNLDSVLIKITDKEKLKNIDRQLGYASFDINRIAWQKEYLAHHILNMKSANETEKFDELQPIVDGLIRDIDALSSRLWDIKGKLSQTDQLAVDQILQEISSTYRTKKIVHLSDMKKYFYKENVSLSGVKDAARQAKKIADQATEKINEARKRIKSRL